MASNLPINQYNQNVANAVKGVPGLGDLMKGLNSVAGTANDIMHQLLPNIFTGDTLQTLQIKAQNSVIQSNYDYYKEDPYFVILFTDNTKTSINFVDSLTEERYNDAVSKGTVVNGVGADGKSIFPNVIKKIIEQIQAEEQAKLLQDEDKSTYGPLYPIINWFRTSTVGNDLKAGATQIGESIKTATGVQTTWSPWIIGGLAVAGALAITYVILED